MDEHQIDQVWRQLHQCPVQGDGSVGLAGPPSLTHISESDLARGDACELRQRSRTGGHPPTASFRVPLCDQTAALLPGSAVWQLQPSLVQPNPDPCTGRYCLQTVATPQIGEALSTNQFLDGLPSASSAPLDLPREARKPGANGFCNSLRIGVRGHREEHAAILVDLDPQRSTPRPHDDAPRPRPGHGE